MMRFLMPILFGLLSQAAYGNVDCETIYEKTKVLSWSGPCKDGRLDGNGELLAEKVLSDGSIGKTTKIGRHFSGAFKGLSLETPDNSQITFVRFWQANKPDLIGPAFITDSSNSHLPIYKRNWIDSNDNDKPISYEAALEKIKSYVASKKEAGMNYEVLKGYFEGRFRFKGEDDPPVLGVTLKPSGGKIKKSF